MGEVAGCRGAVLDISIEKSTHVLDFLRFSYIPAKRIDRSAAMAESTSRGFDGGSDVIGVDQDLIGFSLGQETSVIHLPLKSDFSECGTHLSINEETSEELLAYPPYKVTARELHTCIIASESTRAVCSILIALLVVLSHMDYAMFGVNYVSSKSVLAAKPLYMVLLSDITAVVAHFILRKRRGRPVVTQEEVNRKVSLEGLNWARAVMVLERGLLLHQTIRAIFIDCSVYVVIVACGISIVKPK